MLRMRVLLPEWLKDRGAGSGFGSGTRRRACAGARGRPLRPEVPRVLLANSTLKGGWGGESVDSAFIESIYEEIQTRVAGLQITNLAGEIGEECVIYGRTHGGPGPSGSALRILRWVPGAFSAGYWILADLRGLACFARCSLWSLLGLNFARGARGGGGAPGGPSFD